MQGLPDVGDQQEMRTLDPPDNQSLLVPHEEETVENRRSRPVPPSHSGLILSPGEVVRAEMTISGIVQGVGFRPFVYQLAKKLGLTGFVRNESSSVRIQIQGPGNALEEFCSRLVSDSPPQARIESIEIRVLPADLSEKEFWIASSSGAWAKAPVIPADLATCEECRREIFTPSERRYRYPFTNCTNCGPRWSIIRGLPYDRPVTSMAQFEMCRECREEYEDPADRRFHAQPIACPQCGPSLRLLCPDGVLIAEKDQALRKAAAAVGEGKILALLGLGGFQLVVDATSSAAVQTLRERKRRPHKPFAVMFPTLEAASSWCEISGEEAEALLSPQAPILLVRRQADLPPGLPRIAEEVAPGNPYLGVMLPYTPLHHLLMAEIGGPVVCTSGNLSEEPMSITPEEGLTRLGKIADFFLVHDRPIVRPVDDSVARIFRGRIQLLRRARGYAPLPCRMPRGSSKILAVGAHQKNTVALLLGPSAIVGAHIGDLDNSLSQQVHRRAIEDLLTFYEVIPEAIACDLHPDYASTLLAQELSRHFEVPLVSVQHHHAHIAACMAEHHLQGPVLGVAWDGAGYGIDGTVWGGEFLLVEEGGNFRRVGTLRPFPLPGGEKASREPRRSALGLLYAHGGQASCSIIQHLFTPQEFAILQEILRKNIYSPVSSSVGRLFDAVATLLGASPTTTFEGQAAMELEFLATAAGPSRYRAELVEKDLVLIDWGPLVEAILSDLKTGRDTAEIAWAFHEALAESICQVASRLGQATVVLSGGCFQNRLLSELTIDKLQERGFQVFWPEAYPPNDGGIALGQLAVAQALLRDEQRKYLSDGCPQAPDGE